MRLAERFVRFLGTPKFLLGQSILIFGWMTLSKLGVLTFDPYPWILLNLCLSTQAAYATPLILMGSARQEGEAVRREKQILRLEARILKTEYKILEELRAHRCKCAGQLHERGHPGRD